MNSIPEQTMAEALEGMAEIDEQSARFLIPELQRLLALPAELNMEQFGAQQEEIIALFQRIGGLLGNAAGIRQIIKLAEEGVPEGE